MFFRPWRDLVRPGEMRKRTSYKTLFESTVLSFHGERCPIVALTSPQGGRIQVWGTKSCINSPEPPNFRASYPVGQSLRIFALLLPVSETRAEARTLGPAEKPRRSSTSDGTRQCTSPRSSKVEWSIALFAFVLTTAHGAIRKSPPPVARPDFRVTAATECTGRWVLFGSKGRHNSIRKTCRSA